MGKNEESRAGGRCEQHARLPTLQSFVDSQNIYGTATEVENQADVPRVQIPRFSWVKRLVGQIRFALSKGETE